MPVLIAILGVLVTIGVYLYRARNAAQAAQDIAGMANDVRLAARRFGFRRRTNVHPAEDVDDPHLAIATIAMGFQELDGLPTQDDRDRLALQLRKTLGLSGEAVTEAMTLGRWLVAECKGADPAVSRMARKLYKLGGVEQLQPLMSIVQGALPDGATLSQRQREALDDIKKAFRI